jgi:hypothetical protein
VRSAVRCCGPLALLALLTLAWPTAASADGTITASCTANGVTAACSTGWYTSDVTVSFTLPAGSSNPLGCADQSITSDTTGMTLTCTVAVIGSQCCRLDVPIKRDATPPAATAITAARGPDTNGWYNHPVVVTTVGTDATSGIASCTAAAYSGPDSSSAAANGTCTDNAGNVSAPMTLSLQYDGTPPSVAATPARSADSNGWYNHPVGVAFSGSDSLSGLDSCTSAAYSGPDNSSASVGGTCRDKAGNSADAAFGLQYDATAPAISGATADRPPDLNGWYNHHLVVTFAGSDAMSGIASCDTPAYDKPNDAGAAVTGRCRDNAGNLSAAGSFAFKFDATPPTIGNLVVNALDRTVTLAWKASADVADVKIVRTGGGTSAPRTVYAGKRVSAYTDKSVRNGHRYRYLVTASDAAGNQSVEKALATPAVRLLAPLPEARVRAGTTLRWRPVAQAAYYNVQLWLGKRKVLTEWPRDPSFQVLAGWSYRGASYRLEPGRYVWFVWPGFGARTKHRYGPLVGRSAFVVAP